MDRVTEYARKVVAGEVIAGKLHILACQRHLNDLEKQNTKEFFQRSFKPASLFKFGDITDLN